jgi:hypothetical protein
MRGTTAGSGGRCCPRSGAAPLLRRGEGAYWSCNPRRLRRCACRRESRSDEMSIGVPKLLDLRAAKGEVSALLLNEESGGDVRLPVLVQPRRARCLHGFRNTPITALLLRRAVTRAVVRRPRSRSALRARPRPPGVLLLRRFGRLSGRHAALLEHALEASGREDDERTRALGLNLEGVRYAPRLPDPGGAGQRSPDPVVRNYTLAAASHSSKLGPASFAPGLGSAAPSA